MNQFLKGELLDSAKYNSVKIRELCCGAISLTNQKVLFSRDSSVSVSWYLYLVSNNSPFYSCVLGYQAFEQEWGQELPCINTNVAAFQM